MRASQCDTLRSTLETALASIAQLTASAVLASARSSLAGLKADAGGYTCTDADGNHLVVRTRGEDLITFLFTDEAAYLKVAGQLK